MMTEITMVGLFSKLKDRFSVSTPEVGQEESDEYVEIDSLSPKEGRSKVTVRPFVLEEFDDIKQVLDDLREGRTIALINIKPLKDKDLIELKRAINKIKKTCDAINGDIAGFADDWVVVVPADAQIYRTKHTADVKTDSVE